MQHTSTRNGRIDIMSTETPKYDDNETEEITSYHNALTGIQCNSLLSRAYFSKENYIIIHNAIRAGVYIMSNKKYIIGNLNQTNLKIIMRSIFLQYARFKPDITNEIKCLNHYVIDYAVHNVYNNIIADNKFRHDVSHLAVPIDRPIHTNSKGEHTLEFRCFF